MAKTIIPAPPDVDAAPVAAPITEAHRTAAYSKGVSIDAVVAALRQSLTEAHHSLTALVDTAPADDANVAALRSIHRRLLQFSGAIGLFAPTAARNHTTYR
jgi:hypothetical protein